MHGQSSTEHIAALTKELSGQPRQGESAQYVANPGSSCEQTCLTRTEVRHMSTAWPGDVASCTADAARMSISHSAFVCAPAASQVLKQYDAAGPLDVRAADAAPLTRALHGVQQLPAAGFVRCCKPLIR